MKKRFLAFSLAAVLGISLLTACSQSQDTSSGDSKPNDTSAEQAEEKNACQDYIERSGSLDLLRPDVCRN